MVEKREYTTWEQWSLWDQFGSTGEIIQAFEEVAEGGGRHPWNREEVNVDDAFWNITMSATSQDSGLDTPRRHKSSNQQKDPPSSTSSPTTRWMLPRPPPRSGSPSRGESPREPSRWPPLRARTPAATSWSRLRSPRRSRRSRSPLPRRPPRSQLPRRPPPRRSLPPRRPPRRLPPRRSK